MRLLLDTHVVLWWLDDHRSLPARFREAIAEPRNEVFVSAVSFAEIAIKQSLEKLDAPYISDELLAEQGMRHLPFDAFHARGLQTLPWHHRDPFDRMRIAQAIADDLVFASVDARCAAYGARMLPGVGVGVGAAP